MNEQRNMCLGAGQGVMVGRVCNLTRGVLLASGTATCAGGTGGSFWAGRLSGVQTPAHGINWPARKWRTMRVPGFRGRAGRARAAPAREHPRAGPGCRAFAPFFSAGKAARGRWCGDARPCRERVHRGPHSRLRAHGRSCSAVPRARPPASPEREGHRIGEAIEGQHPLIVPARRREWPAARLSGRARGGVASRLRHAGAAAPPRHAAPPRAPGRPRPAHMMTVALSPIHSVTYLRPAGGQRWIWGPGSRAAPCRAGAPVRGSED